MQVLKSSRANISFQIDVCHTRSQHFRVVELDSADKTEIIATLSALQLATKVEAVHLHHKTLRKCAVATVNSGPVGLVAGLGGALRTALATLAKRVSKVHLHDFPDADARIRLREFGPRLKTLHLHYHLQGGTLKPFFGSLLATVLQKLPGLVELHIVAENEGQAVETLESTRSTAR